MNSELWHSGAWSLCDQSLQGSACWE
jgi:hypothetical protein